MSRSAKSVSKTTVSPRWNEPFTDAGIALTRVAGAVAMPVFDVLEVGRMTLGKEWCYRSVCSPFWRLYQNSAPGAAVRVGRHRIELKADRALLLPPGVEFDCVPAEGVSHLWAHFSVSLCGLPPREPIIVPASPGILAAAATLNEAIGWAGEAGALRHHAQAWMHAIWAQVGENLTAMLPPRLDRVFREIRENFQNPPTTRALAKLTGLSQSAFSFWFKSCTGVSPAAFVRRERIVEACRLLRYTDMSIEEIAHETGFANRYHFSRVFAQQSGVGPSTFRREGADSVV